MDPKMDASFCNLIHGLYKHFDRLTQIAHKVRLHVRHIVLENVIYF